MGALRKTKRLISVVQPSWARRVWYTVARAVRGLASDSHIDMMAAASDGATDSLPNTVVVVGNTGSIMDLLMAEVGVLFFYPPPPFFLIPPEACLRAFICLYVL